MTVVAIDFGTSNTAIAIFDSDRESPKTIKFDDISRAFSTPEGQAWLVPSLVGCDLNIIQLLGSNRKPILIDLVPKLLPTS
jgi:molecular chaperone DnaK (HSP70)